VDIDQCACSGKSLDRFLRPILLAALKGGKSHGYDLANALARLDVFRNSVPDASGVYKTLKVMEKEGLVKSALDANSGGPAKRCYTLTPKGRRCLRQWVGTLREYRDQLDRLLTILMASASAKR